MARPDEQLEQETHTQSNPPQQWIAEQYGELSVRLCVYAKRLLGGNSEVASDIVQDVFARLCDQRWPDIEGYATAWLYRACRNRVIDLLRREGRMQTLHTGGEVEHLPDESLAGPSVALERAERLDELRSSLGQLTTAQQEVLRLRLQDGLSYKQIAEVTGLSVSNVGYQLHDAIVRLRASLARG